MLHCIGNGSTCSCTMWSFLDNFRLERTLRSEGARAPELESMRELVNEASLLYSRLHFIVAKCVSSTTFFFCLLCGFLEKKKKKAKMMDFMCVPACRSVHYLDSLS